jgi:hypothetical protein
MKGFFTFVKFGVSAAFKHPFADFFKAWYYDKFFAKPFAEIPSLLPRP